MNIVAITQRVTVIPERDERRDCLDQRWADLLSAAGLTPLPLPNNTAAAGALLDAVPVAGAILTGGGDLTAYGGDAPERDALETELIARARAGALRLLAVCRGMQMLQHVFEVPLTGVEGHVAAEQEIEISGIRQTVNSYHTLGTCETADELEVWARSDDGVVKAVRHASAPIWGVMWHPERILPPRAADIALLREVFA